MAVSGGDALRGNTRTHPEPMVKPQAADGTALETVWESRWPPDFKNLNKDK